MYRIQKTLPLGFPMLARLAFFVCSVAIPSYGATCDVVSNSRPHNVPVQCVNFDGHIYAVVKVDLRTESITASVTPKGMREEYTQIYAELRQRNNDPMIITNAGIYDDNAPRGLLINNGNVIHELNLDEGHGNFFTRSAVFEVFRDDTARITPAADWKRDNAVTATQSGPQLLATGQRITFGSPVAWTRTAVGISDSDRHVVWLVVSSEPVNLAELQRFLADQLHCTEALHLDGNLSAFFIPQGVPKYVFKDPGAEIITFLSVAKK